MRITLGFGAHFGDAVNQAVVFPTEFEALQREYVILFRRNPEGAYRSIALLGLDLDENLFLEGEAWSAHYVPALHQRGPFSIGVPARNEDGSPEGEPMIHIDPDHPRIADTRGEPVFLPHGGNAPYLDHIADVLRTIFIGSEANVLMFEAFAHYGLIEPLTLDIDLGDGTRYALPDFHTIGGDALRALDGAALEALHRAGFLQPAIWVASSLGNVARLIDRKNARSARAG